MINRGKILYHIKKVNFIMISNETQLFNEEKVFKCKCSSWDVVTVCRLDGSATVSSENTFSTNSDIYDSYVDHTEIKFDGTYKIKYVPKRDIDKTDKVVVKLDLSKKSYSCKHTDYMDPSKSFTKNETDKPVKIRLELTYSKKNNSAELSQNIFK